MNIEAESIGFVNIEAGSRGFVNIEAGSRGFKNIEAKSLSSMCPVPAIHTSMREIGGTFDVFVISLI